jgi:hypothetical protein
VDAKTPTLAPVADAKTPTIETVDAHTAISGRPQHADRHKVGRVRHHLRLDAGISERFRVFCAARRIDFQEFVELAGVHFLECGRPRESGDVDAKTPHDDLKIYKTHEDIIKLYSDLTGNRWRTSDDAEGVQFAHSDRRLIEIGMLQTLLNFKGKRINSFKYFVPEIQEREDEAREVRSSDEQIDGVLRRRRQQWEAKKAERESL